MKLLIVGIGGLARSGKDTFAEKVYQCVTDFDSTYTYIMHMAEPLKHVCGVLFPGHNFFLAEGKKNYVGTTGMTGGQILQKVGTEGLRSIMRSNLWTYCMHHRIVNAIENPISPRTGKEKNLIVLIPDVRFRNEAAFVTKNNGILVRIERPGIAADSHVSETEGYEIGWDYSLNNAGTEEEFLREVPRFTVGLLHQPGIDALTFVQSTPPLLVDHTS